MSLFAVSENLRRASQSNNPQTPVSAKKESKRAEQPTRFALVEVEVKHMETGRKMCVLKRVPTTTSVGELKKLFEKEYPSFYPERQAFFIDKKSPALSNSDCLATHGLTNECELFFHDLGAQSAWNMVFFCQYFIPLLIYSMFYFSFGPVNYIKSFYQERNTTPFHEEYACHAAMVAHTIHYLRRIIEVLFVHKFSTATFAVRHIPKYCLFYGSCTAWMAFVINHPEFSPPPDLQVLVSFIFCLVGEVGAISTHLVLRNHYKNRHIPLPNWNPFTWLFSRVSCPNYTYELLIWISFTTMTNCAVAGINTAVIFGQLFVWATRKHKNYRQRFLNYPHSRKAFIPYLY